MEAGSFDEASCRYPQWLQFSGIHHCTCCIADSQQSKPEKILDEALSTASMRVNVFWFQWDRTVRRRAAFLLDFMIRRCITNMTTRHPRLNGLIVGHYSLSPKHEPYFFMAKMRSILSESCPPTVYQQRLQQLNHISHALATKLS